MKHRNWITALLAVSMMGTLAGCGLKAPETQESSAEQTTAAQSAAETTTQAAGNADAVTLVYAEVNSIDSLDGKIATFFKDKVAEKSNGTVNIDIQASGVLGSEADVLDGMTNDSGVVDLCRISCFALNSYGGKLSSLLSVPFTFENRDQFWKFTETDLAQQILDEPKDLGLGIRVLYFQEEGFRNFFMVKEVNGIEDLKGKKIRVSNDPILTGVVEQLGANPTVISFNELYTSLQSGVVDGGDQPITSYESNAFNETAPYVILDHHTMSASEVLVSEDAWNKLSEEQQKAVEEAGKETSAYAKEVSEKEESESIERLKGKGVKFTEVTDFAPWKEACAGIISEYTKGMEDQYKQITDLAE